MKTKHFPHGLPILRRNILLGLMIVGSLATLTARASLMFTMDFYVANGTYVFYTPMTTNGNVASLPFGVYTVYSPGQPTNGSWREFTYDTNGFITTGGAETRYASFAQAVNDITNGPWTLRITNATITNFYHFNVSIPSGFTSNMLPVTMIDSPTNDTPNSTNLPTFTWHGQPASWPVSANVYVLENFDNAPFQFYAPTNFAASLTNWTVPAAIPGNPSNNSTLFVLNYVTNYAGALFIASQPTNSTNSQTISGWSYNSILETGGSVGFSVAAPPAVSFSHALVAHYAFDTGFHGLDSSTNSFSLFCGSSWGANTTEQTVTNAVAGGGALQFFGESSITPCNDSTFTAWTNVFFGSFTVSAWINTTHVVGNNDDFLYDYNGQSVIYLNNNGNGVLPLGITGTKAAFATGVPAAVFGGNTLASTNSVTTGHYVHVVVTRDQGSGVKQIYINGALDSSTYGEPGVLDGGADYASIGGQLSAPYTGLLDDVQIYSGVLSPFEIAQLHQNPGTTMPDGLSINLGTAVGSSNVVWTSTGDAPWFMESTNTQDGYWADQSGTVMDDQSSTLQTTVVGPGTVSFWWQCIDPSMSSSGYELDFATNGVFVDNINPDTTWTQRTYDIAPGTNVLTWTANAFGDEVPTEMSFVDQFSFISSAPQPVQLLNPQISGSNFQFQFQSQANHTHYLLTSTDLSPGSWVTNRVIPGDGTLIPVSVSRTSPARLYFRIATQ